MQMMYDDMLEFSPDTRDISQRLQESKLQDDDQGEENEGKSDHDASGGSGRK
jgi:hypothetical protein